MEDTPDDIADGRTASTAPEDAAGAEQVEVHHKSHPIHGVREFLKEVGIIVLGVLIAIGAEQMVEALHWGERVREGEAAMRKELTEDDGPQAYQRLTEAPCIAAQLQAVERALVAERDGGGLLRLPAVTPPTFFTWDSDAYRQAMASSIISHMTPERSYAWGSPYTLLADLDAANVRETNDYADLVDPPTVPPHPSDALRERLFSAVARARADNGLLTVLSGKFVQYLAQPGVTLTDAQKRLTLDRDAGKFAACRALRER